MRQVADARAVAIIPTFLLLLKVSALFAADPASAEGEPVLNEGRIGPFLARHCLECHAGEDPKGSLRLDKLAFNFADGAVQKQWLTALARIKAGEMPPKPKPRPSAAEIEALSAWIAARAAAVHSASRTTGIAARPALRRLNRVEYENTIRDLLAIEIDLQPLLPEDSSAEGFDNVGEALHTSSFLMERYLEAADKALDLAIANSPQPPTIKKRYSLKDQHQVKVTKERVFRRSDDTVVLFSSSPWQAVTLNQFYPPDRGTYRFRISATGVQSSGKPVTYRVDAGPMLMGTKSHLVGYFDAPADESAVVEFVDHLEMRSTVRLIPFGLASAQTVNQIGADDYEGPGLSVEWVEVEGPLHESWPPVSHRRLLGDLPQAPAPIYNQRNRVEVVSSDPLADAERILRNFARRAFRRTVAEADVKPFVELVAEKLAADYSFEQALRVGLKGVLVSPEFLFLGEHASPAAAARVGEEGRKKSLGEFALASRLSYFLWSTMPDDELLTLAEQSSRHAPRAVAAENSPQPPAPSDRPGGDGGRNVPATPAEADGTRSVPATLSDPETLRRQVERMLDHPKAAAFTRNFVDQWLGLRDIDFTIPDRRLYPEFDDMLKTAMIEEAHRFFNEVLTHDLSLANFVHSDFTMLNERLAKHYGIAGVDGHAFRKVTLPPDSHRGGVLTMAGVLKVTANGTTTSPVVRGAWVLDRILGTPPSPPPVGVSAIEPDIRGAVTIREQLAKHRDIDACAACHSRIDPPGFALESFDVIGGWRDYYRTVGLGKPVMINGTRTSYLEGPRIDPADELPDGRRFQNMDEFKQLLLEDKDQLARALTKKLLTYATGRAPDAADGPQIEVIVRKIGKNNYGLRTLVHEIVQSDLFRSH